MITPLYKREQWVRWQKLFEGTNAAILWSFDEWLKNHVDMIQKLKVPGDIVYEVEVDIDEYLAWTKNSGLPVDGHTRTGFATHVWTERMKAGGYFSRE